MVRLKEPYKDRYAQKYVVVAGDVYPDRLIGAYSDMSRANKKALEYTKKTGQTTYVTRIIKVSGN